MTRGMRSNGRLIHRSNIESLIMSFDVTDYEGFILTFDDFLKLLKPAHLSGVTSAFETYFSRSDWEKDWQSADGIQGTYQELLEAESILEARRILKAMFWEVTEEQKWLETTDYHQTEVIALIVRLVLPIGPEKMGILGGEDANYCISFGAVTGELILVFDSELLFESRMTQLGQLVARALNQERIEVSNWSVTS